MIFVAFAAASFVLAMRLAVRGTLPTWGAAAVVPLTFLALVVAAFRALQRRGVVSARPLSKRHGFLLVGASSLLTLPMLGAFSLVDPWETHYAEVAREMLERRDVISPWWGHEGWFMSKPILTFWLEALSMLVFGVGTGPDRVLAGGAHPEWAVRFPAAVLAIAGAYVLYYGVSRTCGRRAGLVGALVLWSMPGFALLSHQAVTDMPLVSALAAALGLSLRAVDTGDSTRAPRFASLSLAALVLAFSGAQLAMLALDRGFRAGSPNACGLPGQPACVTMTYAHPSLKGWILAAMLAPLAAFVVSHIAEERRSARLFALAAWFAASVAAMVKGPVGLVVPAGALLVLAFSERSPRRLWRLEIPAGIALAVLLIAPWYLAVFARHGRGFLDELVMRHMLGRTLDHLHDTNDGVDVGISYFILQLGYATFPWSGFVAAAAFSLRPSEDRSRRGRARVLLMASLLVSFALVSSMQTKFHHYVLIALPPAAMIVGLWIDERMAETPRTARFASSLFAIVLATVVLVLVGRDLALKTPLLMHLFTYRYDRKWAHTESLAPLVAAIVIASSAGALLFAFRRKTLPYLLGSALVGSALLLDVYLVRAAPDGGQGKVIAAYYREREQRPTDVPLVAYQLNWKGENFYTGNRIAIFVSSGAPFAAWLARQHDAPVYAVTETRRVPELRRELGPRRVERLTTDGDSTEFALVRADP